MKVLASLTMFFGLILCLVGLAAAADFDGDSRDDVAVFRPSNGQWKIRGVTTIYFGTSVDSPGAGDFDGDGIADPAFYRASNGFWKVKGITQFYFGNAGLGDSPVTGGGGGQRTFEYIVKADDGADLVAALESDTYSSVFIPNGTYSVSEIIDLDNVDHVTGESNNAVISFTGDGYYLHVTSAQCRLENFRLTAGGDTGSSLGSIHVDADNVCLADIRSSTSYAAGFSCSNSSDYVSFVNCVARTAAGSGFSGNINDTMSRYGNCMAKNCNYGFNSCRNLSSCTTDGDSNTVTGFILCWNLAGCSAVDCTGAGYGACVLLSSCYADLGGVGPNGFSLCQNLASCRVDNATGSEYINCSNVDSESCD